ncbi:MAG: drug/metabolite transporter (DMT)-like permease [Candidatus Krumholzibacteriia bacterium]
MGELCALTAALLWAIAVVLFRKSGETVSPLALNLFRVGVSSVLFAGVLLATGRPLLGVVPTKDYLILVASGVIAIAISDTLFHMCLNRVGAGVNAIVDTLYSPFVVIMAWFMLGERLGPWQFAGMGLILSAVILATRVTPPAGIDRRTLVIGVLYGVGAMATLSFGIVLAKPVLVQTDVIWATSIRQFGSLMVLAPIALASPRRREYFGVFKPRANWRYMLPGTFLGSFLALMFWIAGMKLTEAGKAAILNQTSTIYILILAALFLHEPFSWRRGAAAFLALGGIAMVILPAM